MNDSLFKCVIKQMGELEELILKELGLIDKVTTILEHAVKINSEQAVGLDLGLALKELEIIRGMITDTKAEPR